jgi:trans-L-3-hydroxyproline dehydratase
MLEGWRWQPPAKWRVIDTIDLHTGGEPLRVVVGGLGEIKGNTILEKRRFFRENLDFLRTGLMWEPRGHADMYGAVLTEPCTNDGDFGTFFLHNEGYSVMCGHAIIALVKLVLDTGMIIKKEVNPVLRIDAPPGRIVARAIREKGKVKHVAFRNVPSFLYLRDQWVEVAQVGRIKFDVAFGGTFYAIVDAETLGLSLDERQYNQLIELGRAIKKAVSASYPIRHPEIEDLSFLYGTIFVGQAKNPDHHSRNVCIFANGEVDRSATGSGVSARAALHHAKGQLIKNQSITIESILGTTMEVQVVDVLKYADYDAVIPQVKGSAYISGQHRFYFDPTDPLKKGFIFR